ncbi:MAG: glycosyltransferase [Candidatus Dactylopiibacterium sp.]|nr:glycosyltransferase [Candidatus Dactylopiibacterium sp.]
MNLFGTSKPQAFTTPDAAPQARTAAKPDVQRTPVILRHEGEEVCVKIDMALHLEGRIILSGWRTGPVRIDLSPSAGEPILVELDRPDVRTHFSLDEHTRCGFVLMADHDGGPASVRLTLGEQLLECAVLQPQPLTTQVLKDASFGDALHALAYQMPAFSPCWSALVAAMPDSPEACTYARGHLEAAALSERSGQTVVIGWEVARRDTIVWVEDGAGRPHALDKAYRFNRQDVFEAVRGSFDQRAANAGFVVLLDGAARGNFRLRAMTGTSLHSLSAHQAGVMAAEALAAARWLLPAATPVADLHERIPVIDAPLLAPMLEARQAGFDALPLRKRELGVSPVAPEVSIIVPLYGRTDFVEHQLMEFARDPWLREKAEIIYVLDDPALVASFRAEAEALHALYQLPFKWLWGCVNRGFSGANNLGARQARGRKLLFLNSDAFPQRPGWLAALTRVLDERPDIGVVAPRLTFADGSIQHAGMEFRRREELGIWTNFHPFLGLDPALDPHRELTLLPAVTGACMLLRREDFDRVGGWDTGYLIGDFEDSDLCFKLREIGLQVAYEPAVQLTHLERQSFRLLGQDDFRSRVVIYNAVRHQLRWRRQIEALAAAGLGTGQTSAAIEEAHA